MRLKVKEIFERVMGFFIFLREFSQKDFCPKVTKIRQKKRLDS
jgi:hypothetical protein